jgi:nicotinamidase-related amidase
MSDLRLDPGKAALLVVDVQERLWPSMDAAGRERTMNNLLILVETARRLRLPAVWSEQYPKGLGATVPELASALSGLATHRLEKIDFSCAAAPGFAAIAEDVARSQWIVAGIEAHVCVYQTVRDLAAAGATVHVPADAVMSRTAENRAVGLDLVARAGAVVTSTEVVVFDLLQRAGSDDFRALSKLIR